MTERHYNLKKTQGEDFWGFKISVEDALKKAGLEKVCGINYPKTHCEPTSFQADDIYESQGEGGLLLTFYQDGTTIFEEHVGVKVDGTIIYIGATGSLIHRINQALDNREK